MSLTRRMSFACEGDWRALSAVGGGKGTPAQKSFEQKACLGSSWTEAHLHCQLVTGGGTGRDTVLGQCRGPEARGARTAPGPKPCRNDPCAGLLGRVGKGGSGSPRLRNLGFPHGNFGFPLAVRT